MTEITSQVLKSKLKEHFGYGSFRGNQEPIIHSVLDGKDTFVIMPTGAGKSMCYQLPAVLKGGTAIVISPLIALMKNQVDQMNAFGIKASYLNSTLSKAEMNRVKKETQEGLTTLLYVAPESLTKEANIEFLRKCNLSFVAVDEAHCISEWGHDFRPEYRRIREVLQRLGNLQIVALTATATKKVRADIRKNLDMEKAKLYLSSFYRDNLYYEVRPKRDSRKQLVRYVKKFNGASGIIYCFSRKKVEEIAEFLTVNGIRALPYHAGLEPQQRVRNQDAFLQEDADVIVATIAFGMGIDKPDVRFVVHYDAPKSLEGYYQETGRAGRDGLPGHCLLFYSPKDTLKLEKFNRDKTVTERDNAKLLLQEVNFYSNSAVCRPRQLLHYFGEIMEQDCGNCDNCKKDRVQFEGSRSIKLVIQAAIDTGERFGIQHLARFVAGELDPYIKSYGHDKLHLFGEGKETSSEIIYWESVIRQAMIHGFLEKDQEDITVLKLTQEGEAFTKDSYSVVLYQANNYDDESFDDETEHEVPANGGLDETLLALLKDVRKQEAKKLSLQPWMIFQDPALEEMSTMYPTNAEEMASINGVGMSKVLKFGKPFLALLQKYVEEHNIEPLMDVQVKSKATKSRSKISIIQAIDKQTDLEEIADNLGMSFEKLLDELELIAHSGTKLNLDYYLEEFFDEEQIDDVHDYFMQSSSDNVQKALEELGDDEYSIDDIRLLRLRFMSEVVL